LTYALLYGAVRFAMEFLRGDPPVIAGIIVPQVVSGLLVAVGVLGLWWRRSGSWKAHGSLAR
jgi:prolipoprotein diacylglyceryltransferase